MIVPIVSNLLQINFVFLFLLAINRNDFSSKSTKTTFASSKSRWFKKGRLIFATFASDKSQWLQQFFSNTLLRIATTGLRRQSGQKLKNFLQKFIFKKCQKFRVEAFFPPRQVWEIEKRASPLFYMFFVQ